MTVPMTLLYNILQQDVTSLNKSPPVWGMQANTIVDHSPRWMEKKMKGMKIGWKKKKSNNIIFLVLLKKLKQSNYR